MFELGLAAVMLIVGFVLGYVVQLILFVRDKSIVRIGEGQVIVNQEILDKIQKRHKGLADKIKDDDDDV